MLLHLPWEPQLRKLPQKPGVYSFLSRTGEILYIGKAKNLKHRVSAYKDKDFPDKRIKLMLAQARRLNWICCDTELEAILTEAELVRIHKPLFNIRLRDDKSNLYIQITNEEYPRVLLIRKPSILPERKINTIFGPFISSSQTRKLLIAIRHAFPFCNSSSLDKQRKIACFYYHLGLCPGVCIGKIDKITYRNHIENLRRFLIGKNYDVVSDLSKQMAKESFNLNFERAAELRDQIQAIKSLLSNIKITPQSEEEFEQTNKQLSIKLLWKILSPFFPNTINEIPEMPFKRIEAYDVSNLVGKQATGAMVVFIDGIPTTQNYRLFKIKFTSQPDDLAMLTEVLLRRFKHREWQFPELIIIDGGKGQVKAARQSLAQYGLHHKILIVGLSKRLEEVVIYKHKFHILKLSRSSPALHLLMRLRDEAHRFSKNYHIFLRDKVINNLKSK